MTDWLKKLWPEILVLIGIILEFSIKKLQAIEQANEKTTVISLLLALLVALFARHFGGGGSTVYPPGTGANPVAQQGRGPN